MQVEILQKMQEASMLAPSGPQVAQARSILSCPRLSPAKLREQIALAAFLDR